MDILMEVLSGRIMVAVMITQVILREVAETLTLGTAMVGTQPIRMEVTTIIRATRLLDMGNTVALLTL